MSSHKDKIRIVLKTLVIEVLSHWFSKDPTPDIEKALEQIEEIIKDNGKTNGN